MPKIRCFRPSRSSFSRCGQGTSPAVGQTRVYFSPGSQQPTAGAFLLLRVTKDPGCFCLSAWPRPPPPYLSVLAVGHRNSCSTKHLVCGQSRKEGEEAGASHVCSFYQTQKHPLLISPWCVLFSDWHHMVTRESRKVEEGMFVIGHQSGFQGPQGCWDSYDKAGGERSGLWACDIFTYPFLFITVRWHFEDRTLHQQYRKRKSKKRVSPRTLPPHLMHLGHSEAPAIDTDQFFSIWSSFHLFPGTDLPPASLLQRTGSCSYWPDQQMSPSRDRGLNSSAVLNKVHAASTIHSTHLGAFASPPLPTPLRPLDTGSFLPLAGG